MANNDDYGLLCLIVSMRIGGLLWKCFLRCENFPWRLHSLGACGGPRGTDAKKFKVNGDDTTINSMGDVDCIVPNNIFPINNMVDRS